MSKRRIEVDADYMAYLEDVAAREELTVIALIRMSVSAQVARDRVGRRPLTRRGGNDET